jgi:ABC-type transport system involved in cytochrome c biogenesis permease subunit
LLATGGLGVAASYGAFGTQWVTGDLLFYIFAIMGGIGGIISLGAILALAGELVNRLRFRETVEGEDTLAPEDEFSAEAGAPDFRAASSAAHEQRDAPAAIRARAVATPAKLDARGRAMQETALTIKPLSNFIYRAMQVGVLLIAAGTILGGVWADYSWGRFWGWDPKEVWALITLLVYLVPLHGRFAGWVNTFGLAVASVVCFLSVVMAWYGVNFVLGVGLHSYGFTEGGSQGLMSMIIAGVLAIPFAAYWRRHLGYRQV